MFEMRAVDEIVRIAGAGGGFRMDASSRSADDLWLIASAAARGKARVNFVGLDLRPADELWRIATAGKGCVVFE